MGLERPFRLESLLERAAEACAASHRAVWRDVLVAFSVCECVLMNRGVSEDDE